MAHPRNKSERERVARQKARRRTWWARLQARVAADPERHERRHRDTTKLCSCFLCGNPRRYEKGKEKLSAQERREASGSPGD